MRSRTIAAMAALSLLSNAAQAQNATPTAQTPPAEASAAAEASRPPHHLDRCPDSIVDFDNSYATSKLVRKCLGQPNRVQPGRGSDVIWFYSAKGGSVFVLFVFDKTGVLTHFRAYAHN